MWGRPIKILRRRFAPADIWHRPAAFLAKTLRGLKLGVARRVPAFAPTPMDRTIGDHLSGSLCPRFPQTRRRTVQATARLSTRVNPPPTDVRARPIAAGRLCALAGCAPRRSPPLVPALSPDHGGLGSRRRPPGHRPGCRGRSTFNGSRVGTTGPQVRAFHPVCLSPQFSRKSVGLLVCRAPVQWAALATPDVFLFAFSNFDYGRFRGDFKAALRRATLGQDSFECEPVDILPYTSALKCATGDRDVFEVQLARRATGAEADALIAPVSTFCIEIKDVHHGDLDRHPTVAVVLGVDIEFDRFLSTEPLHRRLVDFTDDRRRSCRQRAPRRSAPGRPERRERKSRQGRKSGPHRPLAGCAQWIPCRFILSSRGKSPRPSLDLHSPGPRHTAYPESSKEDDSVRRSGDQGLLGISDSSSARSRFPVITWSRSLLVDLHREPVSERFDRAGAGLGLAFLTASRSVHPAGDVARGATEVNRERDATAPRCIG